MNDERKLLVFPIISIFNRMVIMRFKKSNQWHLWIERLVFKVTFNKSRNFQKLI